jgi:hypothetical protein
MRCVVLRWGLSEKQKEEEDEEEEEDTLAEQGAKKCADGQCQLSSNRRVTVRQ